jgi:hypothetical protein
MSCHFGQINGSEAKKNFSCLHFSRRNLKPSLSCTGPNVFNKVERARGGQNWGWGGSQIDDHCAKRICPFFLAQNAYAHITLSFSVLGLSFSVVMTLSEWKMDEVIKTFNNFEKIKIILKQFPSYQWIVFILFKKS